MWYDLGELECVSQEPRKNLQYCTKTFFSISNPNARTCIISHHFCSYQLTKHLSSERYIGGKLREECLIDFQRYLAKVFYPCFILYFSGLRVHTSLDPWSNRSIYIYKSLLIVIVVSWSSIESISESKKRYSVSQIWFLWKSKHSWLAFALGDFDELRKMKGK